MLRDCWAIVWKEWKELLVARASITDGGWGILLILTILGIVFPLQVGKAWASSPIVLLVAAWVPIVLVHNAIADSFAGERERHTLESLLATRLSDQAILMGKLLAMVIYGVGLTLLVMVLALLSVNIAFVSDSLVFYTPTIGWGSAALILLDAILAAGSGVLVSLRASTVRAAQQALSGLNFLLLLIALVAPRALFVVRIAIGQIDLGKGISLALPLIAMLDIGLMIAVALRFKRARLILD